MSSPRYSDRRIMAQVPDTGKTVSRQTCVDLLISTGPPQPGFSLPDFSNLSLEEAMGRIAQLRLTPDRVHTVDDATAVAETVVNQTPPPGYRVTTNDRIQLTVLRPTPQRGYGSHAVRAELFRFTVPHGFLKKRIQVDMQQDDFSFTIFDEYLAPAQEIWLFIPKHGNPTLRVFVDDQLVEKMPTPALGLPEQQGTDT
jgi:serine/threonine-protein kinase